MDITKENIDLNYIKLKDEYNNFMIEYKKKVYSFNKNLAEYYILNFLKLHYVNRKDFLEIENMKFIKIIATRNFDTGENNCFKIFFGDDDDTLEIRYDNIDGEELYIIYLNNSYFESIDVDYQDLINFKKKYILLDK
jgi:hypothetical protein